MKTFVMLWAVLLLGGAVLIHGNDDLTPRHRELLFGGQIWRIKSPQARTAPGPNFWSNDPDHVWVDDQGLHLTISQQDGRWYSTEVFTRRPLGYGTYTFTLDSDITNFTPDVVAGFFTWDTRPGEAHREIDIEFSAWGRKGKEGTVMGQYVVQPYTSSDRIHIFYPDLQGRYSTHQIVWTPQGVSFSSYHGHVDPASPGAQERIMAQWSFSGTPPTEGRTHFRMNLWLFRGRTDRAEQTQITLCSFRFDPWEP